MIHLTPNFQGKSADYYLTKHDGNEHLALLAASKHIRLRTIRNVNLALPGMPAIYGTKTIIEYGLKETVDENGNVVNDGIIRDKETGKIVDFVHNEFALYFYKKT